MSAYRNAVYDEARKAGYRLSKVEIFLDKQYAIATDTFNQSYMVKLRPKSVEPMRSWVVVKINSTPKTKFTYKTFTCVWNKEKQAYDIYTKDEMQQPSGMRYVEFECETERQCKEWIDSY